jgi:hypothetical protein
MAYTWAVENTGGGVMARVCTLPSGMVAGVVDEGVGLYADREHWTGGAGPWGDGQPVAWYPIGGDVLRTDAISEALADADAVQVMVRTLRVRIRDGLVMLACRDCPAARAIARAVLTCDDVKVWDTPSGCAARRA